MDENISFILETSKESMQAAIDHLEKELLKIRAGKANPVMLGGVRVEYYGAMTPLPQVASVNASDARTLTVTPFDKSALGAIERAIINANLGLNPSNNGSVIIVPIPMLTEDRRRGLVRQAKDEGESSKVSIRNNRRDAISTIKALKDDGVSEDEIKSGEDEVDKLTKSFSAKVDEVLKKKEDEIMTI